MTNLTDEKILEFCRAEKVWAWDDDPSEAIKGRPDSYQINNTGYPFDVENQGDIVGFKNFSLEEPHVFVDGAWYTAKTIEGEKIMVRYEPKKHHVAVWEHFENEGGFYSETELTNIRRIPPEMWEGE